MATRDKQNFGLALALLLTAGAVGGFALSGPFWATGTPAQKTDHPDTALTTPATGQPSSGPVSGSKTRPTGNTDRLSANTPTTAQQQRFLDRLRPIIRQQNVRIRQQRTQLQQLLGALEAGGLDKAQQHQLEQLADEYRISGDPLTDTAARAQLLRRVDVIPASLALAQAANESAWGTSRFAREGNNLFGIWTRNPQLGIVPKNRPPGQTHLVRRFASLADSVRYYMHLLNTNPAYHALRVQRAKARANGERPTGIRLAAGLALYSARGEDYVRLIRSLIRRYELAAIDSSQQTG